LKQLKTAKQVQQALGGLSGVALITGANVRQAWHWAGRAGKFPAHFHAVMTHFLQRRGYDAPPELWSQRGLKNLAPNALEKITRQLTEVERETKTKLAAELARLEKRVAELRGEL
jgi:hypothetical protein